MAEDPMVQQQLIREMGLPPPPPPPVNGQTPPGMTWSVPHFLTAQGVPNVQNRTYRWYFDEALRQCPENARAMENDTVITGMLLERIRGTVRQEWSIIPDDESDSDQLDKANALEKIVRRTHALQDSFFQNMRAIWYGRHATSWRYNWKWDKQFNKSLLVPAEWKPIMGDKLVFHFSGDPGILISPPTLDRYQELRTGKTDREWIPTDKGPAYFWTPLERRQIVLHKHERRDVDWADWQSMGRVMGTGLRNDLYYYWFMKANTLGYMNNYLDRVGAGGFIIYYYQYGDPQSLENVRAAAQLQSKDNVVLFPRRLDKEAAEGIQVIPPNVAGVDLLIKLVTQYYDDAMRVLILGQSLTTSTAGTGMGSGVAEAHESTFSRIIASDAVNFEDTLTNEWLTFLNDMNFPGNPLPRWAFAIDAPDPQEFMEAAEFFYSIGGSLSEKDVREKLGFPEPDPGEAVLSMMGPQQPAALGNPPMGVPTSPPGGPAGMAGPMQPQEQAATPNEMVQMYRKIRSLQKYMAQRKRLRWPTR